MRRHIRYRRSKLIRPTNESTYLNILPSLIPPGTHVATHLRLVSEHLGPRLTRAQNSTCPPLPLIFISHGPASPSPYLPRAFPIFLCLTILIFHNPSCLNIHDGLREHTRTGMSVGPMPTQWVLIAD